MINAAAYTGVDRAEGEEALASLINGDAPTEMAACCADLGIPFVQISTDYVFDGSGSDPFAPEHPASPLGVYGRSKLKGEQSVRRAGGIHAILRTSWVFSRHGDNFVKTMLRLGAERDELRVVADQIGGPTPARAIAAACLAMAEQLADDAAKSGTYHFSGAPDVSWHGFASEILAQAGRTVALTPIATADYPTPATRPLNSRLDCSHTEAVFGLLQPNWRQALKQVLGELESLG